MKSSRWQDKFLNHFSFIFFAFTLLNVVFSFAGPSRTTYQAKIVKPDGYPLEASIVNFKFTILDPSGSCIIFAETYSGVNMTNTGGLISFSLGSGVKTYPVSSTTFEQIFSNITPNIACDTGGAPAVYTPLASDARKIVMQFHDGGGWQTLPAMNINAVPYAMYANDSQKFNGMIPSEFVQVSTIPTCTASEALRYTGSGFQCVAAGGSAAITSGSVVSALGYIPADSIYASNVSSTVFSVSSTVASLSNSVTGISTTVSNLSVSMGAFVSSQWLTSGTTISYNSGNVGIGVSAPIAKLHLAANSSVNIILEGSLNSTGAPGYATRKSRGTIASPTAVLNDDYIGTFGARGYGTTGYSTTTKGMIGIKASENWTDTAQGANIVFETTINSGTTRTEKMRIDHDGNVGVGITSPITKLDVSGGVRISMEAATCAVSYAGTLRYNSGVVEYCNGTAWTAFGVSGSGILAINGLASGSQTFAVGNSGTLPNISSLGSVHNFNFPNAASVGVTAGLISNTDYSNFNNKVNATSAAVIAALAYTPANQVTVLNLSTSMTTLSASVGALVSSQWVTSGTSVNYASGNVGVGTTTPTRTLSVNGDSLLGNLYVRSVATGTELNFWSSSNLIIGGRREADGSIGNGTIPNVLIAPNGAGARGRLAIGVSTTQTVDAYLHVNGDGSTGIVDAAVFGTSGNGGAGRGTGILFRAPSGSASTSDVARIVGVDSSLTFQTGLGGALSERARFDSTGNMGIGTSNPSSRLDLSANSVTDGATLTFSNLTQSTNVIVRTKDYQNNLGWQIAAAGGSQELFSVRDGTGNTRLFINTTNNTMGVGAASATARLQLTSGSTMIPALKFTSGNLVTTPQAGAMEYDGNGFYLTDSSGIRRAISSGSSSGTIDNASTINSTGNIAMVPVGSVIVSSTTASTNSQTGALVVKGGLGVAANIYSSGTIITSSDIQGSSITATSGLIAPYIYGSTVSGGALRLESTTHTTKGNILLAAIGGNVGIGASTPGFKLDVSGTLGVAGATSFNNAGLTTTAANSFSAGSNVIAAQFGSGSTAGFTADQYGGAIRFNGSTVQWGDQSFYPTGGGNGNQGHFRFSTTGSVLSTTPNAKLGVGSLYSAGNVGIGTTTPGSKLHVSGGTIRSDLGTSGTAFVTTGTGSNFQITHDGSSNVGILNSGGGIQFRDATGTINNVTILSSGNVGIGTILPTAALHLKAGLATLAPFKFSSGTLLASPQSGTIEYDGFYYYITDGAGTRRTIATTGAVDTLDNVSIVSGTSAITLWPGTGNGLVVSSTLASNSTTSGALVVKGGAGVAGNAFIGGSTYITGALSTSGAITSTSNITGVSITATTGMITPYLAGSVVSGGNLTIESTTHSSNGKIILAPDGGNVGIGTSAPTYGLHVVPNTDQVAWFSRTGATDNPSVALSNGSGVFTQFVAGGSSAYMTGTSQGDAGIMISSGKKFHLGVQNSAPVFTATAGGNVGIGTVAPLKGLHAVSGSMIGSTEGFPVAYATVHDEFHAGILKKWTETSGNHVNAGIYSLVAPTSASAKSSHSLVNILFTDVASGVASTGSNNSFYTFAARNRYAGNTDNGHVNSLVGIRNDYGHENGVPANAPTTSQLYGALFGPKVMTGTVSNLYDIYISSPAGGGTIGQHYSIYQEASGATNVFNGRIGMGTASPDGSLHIVTSVLQSNAPASGIFLGNSLAADYQIQLTQNSGTPHIDFARLSGRDYDARISSPANSTLSMGTASTSALLNLYNSYVGIGTLTPTRALQIGTTGGWQDGSGILVKGSNPGIELADTQGTVQRWLIANGVSMANDGNLGLAYNVNTSTHNIVVTSGGLVGIGTIAPDDKFMVFNGTTTGRYTTTGWTHISDARYKHDIKTLDNSLDKILKVRGVEYKFKSDPQNKNQVGFIAQEIEPIFPEVVVTDKKGFKSMVYSNLVAPLVEAVKSLYVQLKENIIETRQNSREIASLQQENEKLKIENLQKAKELDHVKARLERIEKLLNSK